MSNNLTYLIIPVTYTDHPDIGEVLDIGSGSITQDQLDNSTQSDPRSLRYSHDKSKVLIKVKGTLNSCYNGITSYTYSEILEVLKGNDWSFQMPDWAK